MRLFLALEPPDTLRERLGKLAELARARCGGRRVPDESLHLTLAFLGEVGDDAASRLSDWVGAQTLAGGEWRLDAWGVFRRPGIVWLGGRRPDPGLLALHDRLWAGLEARGFTGRPARFVPHLTLLRRAERLATEDLPAVNLAWPYRRLALLRSFTENDGARYHTLARSSA